MKVKCIFASAVIALLGLSSCNNDDNVEIKDEAGIVKLHAALNEAVNTRLGTAWAGTETLGFYMVEVGEGFDAVVANKEYMVSNIGAMTAADGVEATYPKDGRDVNFISYFPYSTALVNHVYPIDFTNTSIDDHDLVYAKVGPYNQTQEGAVTIPHDHQLTLLAVHVQNEEGEDIFTATAKINRPVKASFDLKDGSLTVNAASATALDMAVNGTKVEAMIIPGTAGEIVFVNEEKSFTWDISEIDFLAGKKYTYTVKLIPSLVPAVEVVGIATITPWEDVVEEGAIDLDEDEENPGGGEQTTAVYTSNVALPEGTSGVQTSAYGGKVEFDGGSYDCLKLGTGSAGGSYEVAIGAGKTKLSFYACAWGTDTTSPELIVSTSASESQTIKLVANSGASGSSPYTIVNVSDMTLYTMYIAETAAETTVTFSTEGSKKRALIFGVNAE